MDVAQGVVFQHPLVCISFFWLPQLPCCLATICLPTTLSCYHACVHLLIRLSTLPPARHITPSFSYPPFTHPSSINSSASLLTHLQVSTHLPFPCSFTHLHSCPPPSTFHSLAPLFPSSPHSLLTVHKPSTGLAPLDSLIKVP